MKDVLQEWAVRGRLELEPLLHVVSLCQGCERDVVLRVILSDDVVHDGAGLFVTVNCCTLMGKRTLTYLGEYKTGIGIFDDGSHAIAVNG